MSTLFIRADRHTIHNDGKIVQFTPTEWTIIKRLNETPKAPVSSRVLMAAITSYNPSQAEAATYIAVIISRLRKKLNKIGLGDWLENIHTQGYRVTEKIEEQRRVF